jgi:hypothetical protein
MADTGNETLKLLRYLADGGHLNFSDGRFAYRPDTFPMGLDARVIAAAEQAGLVVFRDGFSSSIGSLTEAGRELLRERPAPMTATLSRSRLMD